MEKTATFDDRNADPGLGQSQKYGGVNTVNGIPAFSLLIIGYPTSIQIYGKKNKDYSLGQYTFNIYLEWSIDPAIDLDKL